MSTPPGSSAESNRRCAECGAPFTCDYELGRNPCWCSRDYPAALPMESAANGCLCRACLEKWLRLATPTEQQ